MSNTLAEMNEQRRHLRREFYESYRPCLQELIEAGYSYRDIVRTLNDRGTTNYSGNDWNLSNLSRCMRALGLRTQYMQ